MVLEQVLGGRGRVGESELLLQGGGGRLLNVQKQRGSSRAPKEEEVFGVEGGISDCSTEKKSICAPSSGTIDLDLDSRREGRASLPQEGEGKKVRRL